MHSPEGKSEGDALEAACDTVLLAFVDSFLPGGAPSMPPDRWLSKLIGELECARGDIIGLKERADMNRYKRALARVITRLEFVLSQLYEEQLHH
jgi:hypothetical protein